MRQAQDFTSFAVGYNAYSCWMLTKEDIQKFQAIHFDETENMLTFDEAKEMGTALVEFLDLIYPDLDQLPAERIHGSID